MIRHARAGGSRHYPGVPLTFRVKNKATPIIKPYWMIGDEDIHNVSNGTNELTVGFVEWVLDLDPLCPAGQTLPGQRKRMPRRP